MEDPSNGNSQLSKTAVPAQAGINTGINKRFKWPLRIMILICAAAFAVFISVSFLSKPYDKTNNRYSNITVEEDDSLNDVADKLQESGIVSDADAFSTICRITFLSDFKPGTYYLSPSMDSVTIARTMVNGLTTSNGFTIPAGYNIDQIASSLSRDGFVDKDKFIKTASSDLFREFDFIGSDISGAQQLEGFLFPDEYIINSDADESMIIITMLDRFNNFFNDDYKARADELNMSTREIIIIASMIEIETSNDKERPLISSVIHNRLNLGMMEDGEFPEVPLCSPGADSIIAALYPEETEYTYYVLSDKLDGTHVFTSDEQEYQQYKDAYDAAAEERDSARNTRE